ncbi:hypothetical protein BH10ACT4_BH10ACT4_06870 [soil metagenome]
MPDLLLIAASGLAREVLSADQGDHNIVGILDDDPTLAGTVVGGVAVLGGVELALHRDEALLICVGPGSGRQKIATRLAGLGVDEARFATLIDRSVRVPPGCRVGAGSILLAGVVLTADVTVGRHVVAMPQVILTHDDRVGDFATLAAHATLGGSVSVGEAAYLGMSCSVRQGVSIGAEATVGMGAVVLTDVPDGETWAGVPARALPSPVGATR